MSSRPAASDEPASIVLLAIPGASTRIVFHALQQEFGSVAVVLEEKISRATVLRRRVRRQGVVSVLGQVLFLAIAAPILVRRGQRRIDEIAATNELDRSEIDEAVITRVASMNSAEAREALVRLAPTVIVINGTRIIGAETLQCVDAPFLNMHAGITPQYRGVHGGYWALAEHRPHLVGTTVHIVDTGIDTGPILAQPTFVPTRRDSFATYPYLHLAAGLPALVAAMKDVLDGRPLTPRAPLSQDAPSMLRSHPTLWGYLSHPGRHG